MQGCYKYHNEVGGKGSGNLEGDAERGTRGVSLPAANPNMTIPARNLGKIEARSDRQIAGLWGYIFQVMFQVIKYITENYYRCNKDLSSSQKVLFQTDECRCSDAYRHHFLVRHCTTTCH